MGSVAQLRRPLGDERTEPPSISDEALVEAALAGDRWAEDALVRRHIGRVVQIASYLIADPQEVDDVVQETFLLAFADLRRLRDPGAFRPWLVRIAVHRSRRVIRRRRLLRTLGLDRGADEETLAALAAPSLSPDTRADLVVVDDVLKRCSVDDRVAWLLRHVAGCSIPEVAEACACSESTAKRRVNAAQARLDEIVEVQDDG
jgi:RNA polymerase sigma-70 factor (ECF subfamily)